MATRRQQQSAGTAAPHSGHRARGRRALAAAAVLLLAAGLAPPPAGAAPDWRRSVQEQLEPNTLAPRISLEQAANKVRRETGGRVLSASPSNRGGESGYEIRVLLEGKRVKSYFVDDQGRVRARD